MLFEELLRIYDLATENDSDLKIAAEKINEYDAQRINTLSKYHSTLISILILDGIGLIQRTLLEAKLESLAPMMLGLPLIK